MSWLSGLSVGMRLGAGFLDGRRNGVLVEHATGRVWWETARTKRGARRLYLSVLDWLPAEPGRPHAEPGDEVAVFLVVRRRIVDTQHVRIPGEWPPDAGLREPRRSPPSLGGAAATAPHPDGP